MPAFGNKNWMYRSKHGAPRKYESAQKLANACDKYLLWAASNPLEEEQLFHYQGKITRAKKTKMRAMSVCALCTFLGITQTTWFLWAKTSEDDVKDVITRVTDIIWAQKFEGAAAELLSANIIARQLGLGESVEITASLTVVISKDDDASCG